MWRGDRGWRGRVGGMTWGSARCCLGGCGGGGVAVQRMQRQLAELLRHEHASLALAQRCSGVAAPAPLFGSLLNYRHIAVPKDSGSPTAVSPGKPQSALQHVYSEERTNYPLMLSLNDWGDELSLSAQVVQGPEGG